MMAARGRSNALAALAALLLVASPASASEGFSFAEQGLFILDFVVLIGLLAWFLRKKFKAYMAERSQSIRKDMDEAAALHAREEALAAEKERHLARLMADREAMLARFREEAEKERARILAEARERAERLLEETRRQAEAERRQMLTEFRELLVERAVSGARESLVAGTDAVARARWTDAAIAGLEKAEWGAQDAR
jgi:F-type H+-transporting ATPase subunit b